jgi:hypothetical protein
MGRPLSTYKMGRMTLSLSTAFLGAGKIKEAMWTSRLPSKSGEGISSALTQAFVMGKDLIISQFCSQGRLSGPHNGLSF